MTGQKRLFLAITQNTIATKLILDSSAMRLAMLFYFTLGDDVDLVSVFGVVGKPCL